MAAIGVFKIFIKKMNYLRF